MYIYASTDRRLEILIRQEEGLVVPLPINSGCLFYPAYAQSAKHQDGSCTRCLPLAATMLLSRNAFLGIRAVSSARRNLSSRASTILSALDISTSEELPGVYDGEWKGTGEIFESVCPTTGEVLARVQSVSLPLVFRHIIGS